MTPAVDTHASEPPRWLYRLRRFLRVSSVTIDGFRLIAYRTGVPKHVSQMLVRGDYEVPERRAVSEILRQGDRVLEIGSCVGLVALTAARKVGAANVLSFEPNPDAAAIARENFANNTLPVDLVNAAVGTSEGTLTLTISPESWLGASGRRSIDDGRTLSVPMRAIANVVGEFKPSVLVIDTEGMEEEILPACPLDGLRAIVAEFHPDVIGAAGVARLQAHLHQHGFVRNARLSAADTETWERSAS